MFAGEMTTFKRHTNQWEKLIHHICHPHKELHIFLNILENKKKAIVRITLDLLLIITEMKENPICEMHQ
jgi:hypothetical protein